MKVFSINDICEIKSGKRIPLGFDFVDYKTPHPYIRARDIKNGNINTDDLIFLEENTYNKIKKYIINENDIAITIVGASIGDVGFAQKNVDGFNLTENAVRLTHFNDKANSKYVYYLLIQKQYKELMQTIAGGEKKKKLGIYKIQKIKVCLPSLHDQEKIASILSAYDNLIENNNKRINILEQMAENLYKEWFVRFRFPGHETARFTSSNMGKIPSTFTLAKMQDVFEYYIGGGWGEDEYSTDFPVEAKVIRGTDFPFVERGDLGTCPNRFHKESNYKARKLEPGDIILEVSGGTAEQPVGRTILVSQQMLDRFNGQVICASFCKLVRLKKEKISPVYFYYWMQFLYETRIIDRFQLQSTGIINFKFEYFLKKGDVMLPPSKIMKDFEDLVSPIHAQIEKLAMETENLIKQRDLLLPRLMNGKLAV